MRFWVYGRDRPGGFAVKVRLAEEHWSFMDRYADRLIARGPTLTGRGEDAETTGSLHIVDLPSVEAVERFAFTDPYHLAGAFTSVQLCRFGDLSGRTIWEYTGATEGFGRFLVRAGGKATPNPSPQLMVYGDLRTLDDTEHLGQAALLEAPDARAAALLVGDSGRTQVDHWEFGGRR